MNTVLMVSATLIVVITLVQRLFAAQRRIRDLRGRLLAAEQLADTDPLTGLANRSGLNRALAGKLRDAGDKQVAALVLDLDRLKQINDRHGHSTGDAVLAEMARRMKQHPAPVACTARLGGDEFVIVLAPALPSDIEHYAEAYARAIWHEVGTPVIVDEMMLTVSASIGIAILPASADVQRLLDAADHAMYHAKYTGSGICRYMPDCDEPEFVSLTPAIRPGGGLMAYRAAADLEQAEEHVPVQRAYAGDYLSQWHVGPALPATVPSSGDEYYNNLF